VGQFVLEHHVDVDVQPSPEPSGAVVQQPAVVGPPGEFDHRDAVARLAEARDELSVVAEATGARVEVPVQRQSDSHTAAS
jgi:hypothetical protein